MATDAGVQQLDDLIRELRTLRVSTGVSYRELASRIAAQREQRGTPPAQARIAHTTVSDVFRTGRTRVNADLVAEIVQALSGDDVEAAHWRARAARARVVTVADPVADPVVDSGADFLAPSEPTAPSGGRPTVRRMLVLLVVGVVLNSSGKFLNPLLGDVLFLDMVGTGLVAVLAGPWLAALAGALFVVTELLKGEVGDALFALTMVTAGLLWGYGAQRFGMARTLPRFLALSGLVAITTSAIAVPIIVLFYGGHTGRGMDGFVSTLAGDGVQLWLSVGAANLAVSLVDKLVVGAIVFLLARMIGNAADVAWTPQARTNR